MEYKVIIQHRDHIGYVVYTSSELITNAIMETNKYKEYLKRNGVIKHCLGFYAYCKILEKMRLTRSKLDLDILIQNTLELSKIIPSGGYNWVEVVRSDGKYYVSRY